MNKKHLRVRLIVINKQQLLLQISCTGKKVHFEEGVHG